MIKFRPPRLPACLASLAVCVLLLPLGDLIPPASRAGSAPDPPGIKRSSSAIAITPDGTLLLVVNPDSNSLSIISLSLEPAVTEIATGADPRSVAVDDAGQRAYVSHRGSDSVAVIDVPGRALLATVAVGRRPYGAVVSPDGRQLYVAEQGANRVRVLDTATLETALLLPTADRPSGLALSADGRTLYVTHLLANTVSVFTVSPRLTYLPLLSRGGAGGAVPGALPAVVPAPLPARSISLWPDSNLVQAIVLSPDGRRAYIPHTRSNTANTALTFDTTVFPLVSQIDLATEKHLVGQQFDLGVLDPPGVGLPFDAAFTPDGRELWVVNAASNDLTVMDLATRQRVAHIEVGDNPRGIVLSPDGSTAYVNNTLAGTVSVLDTAAYTVTATIQVTNIPLPAVLLEGKRLFHSSDDPRMSLNQWISCNTCHFEGEHDGRTWSFGFAGKRNTTGLGGMIQTYPLRWSGEWDESADGEFAIRKENFGSGLVADMYCSLSPPDCVNQPPNQGRSYPLDSLASFMDSLPIPLSPAHAHGEPLNAAEQRGRAIFNDPALGCVGCHPAPLFTDRKKHDVGTAGPDEKIGPAYDTPSLRGLYDSAPYFHDGSAATLLEALTRPTPRSEHDLRGALTEAQIADLVAFLLALPYEE